MLFPVSVISVCAHSTVVSCPLKGTLKDVLPMLIGTVALRAQGTATSDDMQVDKTQAK